MDDLDLPPGLPPLEWIRVFEAAGRLGSFTAAADELSLTQSAVSQRIRKLEDRLQVSLFTRLPRGVELTVDGEGYLHHVQFALNSLSKSTYDLFDRHRPQRVSIAATVSVANLWIAPRMRLLEKARLNVRIYLASVVRFGDFDAIGADLEVRYGSGWADRQGVRLYEDVMSPVCAPSLLAEAPDGDWRRLPSISLIGPRLGWADWAATGNPAPSGPLTHRFDTFIAAMGAAVAGVGVLLGSLPLCQEAIRRGDLVRLSEQELRAGDGYWLLWPEGKAPMLHLEPLVDILTRESV